jgi:hypothetical protein
MPIEFRKEHISLRRRARIILHATMSFMFHLLNPRIYCYHPEEKSWALEPFSFRDNLNTYLSEFDTFLRGYWFVL